MNTSPSGPSIGTLVDDKYRLTGEIGRGGMATIYAAENVDIGKPVAVKVLAEELTHSKTVNERFLREARAAAKIRSPYICEVYDVGTYAERPFIVMELLHGESLYERLSRDRQLPQEEAFRIAWQVGKGLAKAHRAGIIHRDLKPENIFLCETDEGEPTCKIVDFGLAKFYEPANDSNSARLTKEGALFGTPAYMSPEQAGGLGNVDERTDLWALGCIVYEMLTGATVWNVGQGVPMILAQIATAKLPAARKYRPDLPLTFEPWFAKALARRSEDRFQSVSEFLGSLKEVLAPNAASWPGRSTPEDSVANPFEQLAAAPLPPPPAARSAASVPPPSHRSGRGRKVALLGALGAALFGVGLWFTGYWGAAAWFAPTLEPSEKDAYGPQVNHAQAQLADGRQQEALAELQRAFESTQGKAARSLQDHLEVAVDPTANGRCSLAAIGHPRPFSHKTKSTLPALANTSQGLLVAWADSDIAPGRAQVFTARLDENLRRASEPVNVTPETYEARAPQLLPTDDGLGLLFWDFSGPEPGVYVRHLTTDGHATDKRRRLSQAHDNHPYYPAYTRDADGNFWLVWAEPTRERVHDLLIRKLSPTLEPLTQAKTLTGYATPAGTSKTQAAHPAVAMLNGLVHVTFTLRRGGKQQIVLLRTPPQAIEGSSGVQPVASESPPKPSNEEYDRFLGQAVDLSPTSGRHDRSSLRCSQDRCVVAWDEALEAAWLAQIQLDGAISWRRRLAGSSARPGLGNTADRWLAGWFADNRVFVAPLHEGTPIGPSAVGKVSAILTQPSPILQPAERAGEWYVAWRGYEAGAEEPFIARVRCQ